MIGVMSNNIVNKLWGTEEWLVNDSEVGYCFKRMTLKPGCQCSLHYHNIKDETFYIVEGELLLSVDGINHRLQVGDYYRIKPGSLHRFKSANNSPVVFLESSSYHDDNDVVRLEESNYCD